MSCGQKKANSISSGVNDADIRLWQDRGSGRGVKGRCGDGMLFVSTMYPQAGPEEVERLITQKIEESCGTISGLKQMSSTSSEGVSEVTFQFAYGTDLGVARTNLQEALEDAKIEFPEGIQSPPLYR